MKKVDLLLFKNRIEIQLEKHYPDRIVFHNALKTPPSSMSGDSEDHENKTWDRLEAALDSTGQTATRTSLPHPLEGRTVNFSRATQTQISNCPSVSFDGDAFATVEVTEDMKLHVDIALLMIEWNFHHGKAVQNFESPSKPLRLASPNHTRLEKSELHESIVQKYLSRVLIRLCAAFGMTLHDARSSPKLFLKSGLLQFAGFTDFLICSEGCIMGLIEIKVFFNKMKYLPQLVVSTQALSAGVNGSWDISKLSEAKSNHVFGLMFNGFQLLRCETALVGDIPGILMDSKSLDSSLVVEGICQMLERAKRKQATCVDQLGKLSLGSEDSASGGKGGGTGGNGDGKGDGDGKGRDGGDRKGRGGNTKTKKTSNTKTQGKSKASTAENDSGRMTEKKSKFTHQQKAKSARVPLAKLQPLHLLAKEFESCENDPIAGLLGWRHLKVGTGDTRFR